MGHQIAPSEKNFRPVAHPTWSFTLQPGEDIRAIVPPAARGPIASFGKVLGNRTTLYKYLNPRLFTVLTAFPAKRKCGLYVLDSMKGTVVYRAETKASLKGCEVKSTMVENWLLYHYYESEIEGSAKGHRVVSVEFYEGQGIDEKTRRLVSFIPFRTVYELRIQFGTFGLLKRDNQLSRLRAVLHRHLRYHCFDLHHYKIWDFE